jgi:hypothetical protein
MAEKYYGLNIQWPWSRLILNGKKTVETRTYPIPRKHLGKPLAIIETAGSRGKKEAGINKAMIIGLVTFKRSFPYETKKQWVEDSKRHLVPVDHTKYTYQNETTRWGWEIDTVKILKQPKPAPSPRGIVFAKDCEI